MKALTVSQPHADLIADGFKWVENRTWASRYRGPLAIHAGKSSRYLPAAALRGYDTGVVVATCELVACVHLVLVQYGRYEACDQLTDVHIMPQEVLGHEYTEGPWCWILKSIKRLDKPIPAVGKQRLWNIELPYRVDYRISP